MIELTHRFILPAAYSLLPPQMDTPQATAMLLAIGLQESRFKHRQQIGGPAHGFYQFERGGGVAGVLKHDVVGPFARQALTELRYDATNASSIAVHGWISDNDVLAAVFARLLLWTVPGRLPTRDQTGAGWRQYIDGWRPGKPHQSTWPEFFAQAWRMVEAL